MARSRSTTVEVFGGSFWFVGWLFTIGYTALSFWQGVLAIIIWPYYLGINLAG